MAGRNGAGRRALGYTSHPSKVIRSWMLWCERSSDGSPINGQCWCWRRSKSMAGCASQSLGESIGGVSQKMLTKTLRQMEADGLVSRTVFPVIPPRVEYQLTDLGHSLGEAFCGVWIWAERNRKAIDKAGADFESPRGDCQ